ncbi:hypothetical protein BegalDRAFT_2844 [Beggiatoa alba B18LD]|uniref:Uncharacterized protein n=1 Tax=Beggiatoa alba B18LD TaxID=395493 RepID=I3CJ85_9GAMM|nr:hypothetical protein [Beggiatoa alba]EIJ43678.1 hypothetical protein BegalDRAFT_2844 [Beggiatoa alba B18LD]
MFMKKRYSPACQHNSQRLAQQNRQRQWRMMNNEEHHEISATLLRHPQQWASLQSVEISDASNPAVNSAH